MYLYLGRRGRGQVGGSRREMKPRCDVGGREGGSLRSASGCDAGIGWAPKAGMLGFCEAEAHRGHPKGCDCKVWWPRMAWRMEHRDCRVPASGICPAGSGQVRRSSKVGVSLGGPTEAWQLRKAVRRHALSWRFLALPGDGQVSGTHRTGLCTVRERTG
jgi:hypothetical protein